MLQQTTSKSHGEEMLGGIGKMVAFIVILVIIFTGGIGISIPYLLHYFNLM
jgi:hypothetical protein